MHVAVKAKIYFAIKVKKCILFLFSNMLHFIASSNSLDSGSATIVLLVKKLAKTKSAWNITVLSTCFD